MLLFTSSHLSVPSSIPTVTLYPAKALTCNVIILRTPSLILRHCWPSPLSAKPISRNTLTFVLRDAPTLQHVYPDPSPEFAESETQKFKVELFQKLSEDVDEFGDDLDTVIDVCAQIALRWIYEQEASVIVESFNKKRMKQNIEIFDWELSQEVTDKINQIPQQRLYKAEMFVSENGPYKSLEEQWDGGPEQNPV